MKFIKYFKEILESIINLTNVKNWFVKFNHSKKHDLDIKMSNRTELSDKKFEAFESFFIFQLQSFRKEQSY